MITLGDFLDLYGYSTAPVIVFDYDIYDTVIDEWQEGRKWNDYSNTPIFGILPQYSEFRAIAYLKEKYITTIVKRFIFTDEGMVVFIEQ